MKSSFEEQQSFLTCTSNKPTTAHSPCTQKDGPVMTPLSSRPRATTAIVE